MPRRDVSSNSQHPALAIRAAETHSLGFTSPKRAQDISTNSELIHRVTVTQFRSISMPADFCLHLVGKNSEKCLLL